MGAMAAVTLRLCWLAAALLLWTHQTQCAEYTTDDIRGAINSLVHLVQRAEDKLERHEYREKVLGDHVKRMLMGLEKKHRELEPLKGIILRLDERLSNVETILLHKDINEKKTNEALEGIKKSIQTLTTTVDNLKASKVPEIDNNLTTNDESIEKRLDTTDSKIDDVKNQIASLKKSFNKDILRSMCVEVASDMNPFTKHITDAEKLLNKFELKLKEYNGTKAAADIAQLNDVALAEEACHGKLTEEMVSQGKEITKIQRLLSDAEGVWKQLPTSAQLQAASNRTLEAVVKATDTITVHAETAVGKVTTKVRQLNDLLVATNSDIQQSLTEGNTQAERAFSDISRGYHTLLKEVQSLMKSDKVMLETAQNVIVNRDRIDFSVNQILVQISDLVLAQGNSINSSLTERLDRIEASIMGNQALSHVNLTTTIETKISQVWRQIGAMHEQMKANKAALDTLSEETEKYVNSSSKTMKRVKDDVGNISVGMMALSDDFNHALGKLSMTTDEFSLISSRLADTMTSLKTDGLVITTTPRTDAGPGPHIIADPENKKSSQ